ncbi:hypothetical protein CYMTET_23075 [Cymbomonas tetramitiformis]|uniref:Uncharacterized protein n=1 Tax=Cymbomonas tetramitiformis TaxID=36881 RepID=A0AAE0L1B0_9CHLO|nr:hypothetical protein CYMTET_23075 [Cymbomonas tetramitiformis]
MVVWWWGLGTEEFHEGVAGSTSVGAGRVPVPLGATSEMPSGVGRVDRRVAEWTGQSARVGAVSGVDDGDGRPGQRARRRQAMRTMESLTQVIGDGGVADVAVHDAGRMAEPTQEGSQAAGLVRGGWGLGAGVLGRRLRVRWPVEEASFDGVINAWLPGERRHACGKVRRWG